MPFTILARYSTPWEAHVDRALLESEGIDAFLLDEHMVGANWMQGMAFGDVKLAVQTEHAEAAGAVLAARRNGTLETALNSELAIVPAACPACGSTDLAPHIAASDRAAQVVTYAVLGVFHPPTANSYKCGNCKKTFAASVSTR